MIWILNTRSEVRSFLQFRVLILVSVFLIFWRCFWKCALKINSVLSQILNYLIVSWLKLTLWSSIWMWTFWISFLLLKSSKRNNTEKTQQIRLLHNQCISDDHFIKLHRQNHKKADSRCYNNTLWDEQHSACESDENQKASKCNQCNDLSHTEHSASLKSKTTDKNIAVKYQEYQNDFWNLWIHVAKCLSVFDYVFWF